MKHWKVFFDNKTKEEWELNDPVIHAREIVLEDFTKAKVGDGVKPYSQLPYLLGGGAGLEGTNYVFVQGNGTPEENAVELQVAYNKAKTMVKSTVIVAPGVYTFGSPEFVIDTPYIDIVSLTGNSDVLLDGVNVTANNVYLKGLNCGAKIFRVANSLDKLVCENCTGLGDYSFGGGSIGGITSGTFINCKGGEYSFGGGSGEASGTFSNCTGGNNSFGGVNGEASGTFSNCTGGDDSFGGSSSGASGIFENCTGGDNSFGGLDGVTSGIFKNCTGGDDSFGGSGSASGIFENCTGGDNSFGGLDGVTSGTFTNCVGGNNSFGSSEDAITSKARLYFCRLTSGTFSTPAEGGKLVLCIDSNDNIVTTP